MRYSKIQVPQIISQEVCGINNMSFFLPFDYSIEFNHLQQSAIDVFSIFPQLFYKYTLNEIIIDSSINKATMIKNNTQQTYDQDCLQLIANSHNQKLKIESGNNFRLTLNQDTHNKKSTIIFSISHVPFDGISTMVLYKLLYTRLICSHKYYLYFAYIYLTNLHSRLLKRFLQSKTTFFKGVEPESGASKIPMQVKGNIIYFNQTQANIDGRKFALILLQSLQRAYPTEEEFNLNIVVNLRNKFRLLSKFMIGEFATTYGVKLTKDAIYSPLLNQRLKRFKFVKEHKLIEKLEENELANSVNIYDYYNQNYTVNNVSLLISWMQNTGKIDNGKGGPQSFAITSIASGPKSEYVVVGGYINNSTLAILIQYNPWVTTQAEVANYETNIIKLLEQNGFFVINKYIV